MQLPTDRFPIESDFDDTWNLDIHTDNDTRRLLRSAIEEDLIGSNRTIGVMLNGIWTPHNNGANLETTNGELRQLRDNWDDAAYGARAGLSTLLTTFNEKDATPAPALEYPGLLAVSPRLMGILRNNPGMSPGGAVIAMLQEDTGNVKVSAQLSEPK